MKIECLNVIPTEADNVLFREENDLIPRNLMNLKYIIVIYSI